MQRFLAAGALALAIVSSPVAFAEEAPLGLTEAVHIAVTAKDPSLLRFDARAEALEDRAVADAQIPDPMIKGTISNLPTDTFKFDQESMTQAQAGLRQEFPAGRTLAVRGNRGRAEANAERARKEVALRQIERSVRTAWLDLFYWTRAEALISRSRSAVGEMIDALSASFATGTLNTQDILRAELELSLLDDRLTEARRRADAARAGLVRYVEPAVSRPLTTVLPVFPAPSDLTVLEEALIHHPSVFVEDAEIAVANTDIELAEEAYKPSWALEGGYGARGGGRVDFATVGVTLSIPLFTENRQDRRLSAAVNARGAKKLDRAALLLDLRRDLDRAYADWRRFGARADLYRDAVIKRANETAEASVSTYANGLTDFPELIRSQLAELDTELKFVELRVEQAKAWAVLDYLVGDIQ